MLAAQLSVEKRAEEAETMSELGQGSLGRFQTMQVMRRTCTDVTVDKKRKKSQTALQNVDGRIQNQTAIQTGDERIHRKVPPIRQTQYQSNYFVGNTNATTGVYGKKQIGLG